MLRKLNHLLFALLLATATLYATDARLNSYPQAQEWEEQALDGDADAMYNLAHTYQTKLEDFDKAIYWYEKAYNTNKDVDSANNLGYVYKKHFKNYEKAEYWYKLASDAGDKDATFNLALLYDDTLQQKEKAVDWYKRAYTMGDMGGANSLGYLCEHTLHDDACAEEWYLKAAKGNERKAIGNLAKFYHKKGENVRAGAYAITLIGNGYTKKKIFSYMKKWNLTKDQIKQAYELQKTLDIPKHYTDEID